MTETEWLACTDPTPMLESLRGKASDRKLRLFAVACCRDIWDLITSEPGRNAVNASEAYADGLIRRKDLIEARERVRPEDSDLAHWAVMAVSRPKIAASWIAHLTADAKVRPGIHQSYSPTTKQSPQQCHHLRDIFGPVPFRRISVSNSWLSWNEAIVRKLAQVIYEERRFSDLPILADALEEAGCSDQDILMHCRQPGEHVRGCWLIDSLLRKS